MPLRAALFDIGDTLVEHWAPRERVNALAIASLRRAFGERDWYERFLAAELGPNARSLTSLEPHRPPSEKDLRQETLRWYGDWLRGSSVDLAEIDLDRLRSAVVVPLDLVSTLVPGAAEALRWCRANRLRVVLVTNTLARGDAEVADDWRRFGLSDTIDGAVSSHSVGWQKPHPRIFERALDIAGVVAADAVMIGDRLDADVLGASRLGMRTVLRRTPHPQDAVDVRPDAAVDDLTELPAVLGAWLGVPTAHQTSREDGTAGP